jgi:CHAT domain-containing protein
MVAKKYFFSIFFLACFSLFFFSTGKAIMPNDTATLKNLENRAKKFETIFYYSDRIDSSIYLDGFATFTQLIESCIDMQRQSGDRKFAEKAYYYLERLKSIKLLLLLKNANLPDSTRAKQYQLLSRQLELYREQLGMTDPPYSIYEDTLAQNDRMRYKSSVQSFQDSVRSIDPNLYLLLLFQQPVDLNEITQSYLHQNQIIFDFWVNDERLFLFMIATDSTAIFQYEIPAEQIKSKISKLMSSLHQKHDLLQLQFDYKLAHELYQQLFKPIEKYALLSKEIIIIPDNFLTGFPFEILVTDTSFRKNTHAKDALYDDISKLTFLVHQHAFSYNYSIKALSPQFLEFQIVKNLGRRLLAMNAPIITSSSSYSSYQIDELYFQLQNLNNTNAEIKRVARLLWRHNILTKGRATKNYFLNSGRFYRWIYLALPGILNNNNPMNSALLFTQDYTDSLVSSAWMSASEVMKSKLSADLLTMSGCEALPIDQNENQGLVALPQAFLYAGVKSVLLNQWHVESSYTSEFMAKFYWELKYKRQTNALALQQAKIASLKNTFVFKKQKISGAHPHFWASFMLIGNPNIRPPYKERIPPWGIIIMTYVVIILVALYITRKTRQK